MHLIFEDASLIFVDYQSIDLRVRAHNKARNFIFPWFWLKYSFSGAMELTGNSIMCGPSIVGSLL